MRVENGKVIFERKNCTCGDGKQARKVPCTKCGGTGNGPRGGANTCKGVKNKGCFRGYTWDHNDPIPCSRCNGDFQDHDEENDCDYLPKGVWQRFDFKVYRNANDLTVGEFLMGYGDGTVFSCTDYGRHEDQSDEELIASVRDRNSSTQACKVIDQDHNLASHIGIFCSPNGYAVRSVFKKE